MKHLIPLLLLTILISACKTDITGELLPNQAPETHTAVDTIIRFGEDRLESRVEINWWGDDPDGLIAYYEYTFDEPVTASTVWLQTKAQDSVFLLQTPPGQDTVDFRFSVRAIDNQGLADPTPATASYPVRNSPPFVSFVSEEDDPTLTFPILKLFWEGGDPDGPDNVDHYELFWNDTTATPYIVDASTTAATFSAVDPTALGSVNSEVFLNNSTVAEAEQIPGMLTGQWNVLYARAVDQSDAKSGFAPSDSVFIKPVRSNILMVNAYSGGGDPVFDFYSERMTNAGYGSFDTLVLFDLGSVPQIAADNLTQSKIFDLYDLIIWFGNNAESSLSLAQRTTSDFFASGGKLFMSVYVSSSFDEQSNFLDFTPIAELVDPVDTTLILDIAAQIEPEDATWPTLESEGIVGVVRPIRLQIGAEPVYRAELIGRDAATLSLNPWNGEDLIMGRKRDAAGNSNFLISTLEIHTLDGNGNLDVLFGKVLEEFDF